MAEAEAVPDLERTIDAAWEAREGYGPDKAPEEVNKAVTAAIDLLDRGRLRVASPGPDGWTVNAWLKKAVLLSFRLNANRIMPGGAGGAPHFDKVPLKYAGYTEDDFRRDGVRVVPPATVRKGDPPGRPDHDAQGDAAKRSGLLPRRYHRQRRLDPPQLARRRRAR